MSDCRNPIECREINHMSNTPETGRPVPISGRPTDYRDSTTTAYKDRYGGIKVGSAFLGWLTAIGAAIVMAALASAIAAAVGLTGRTGAGQAADEVAQDPQTAGLIGGIVLMVILFAAYYVGGYVAGRMAQLRGLNQGIAVWVWGLLTSLALAGLGAIAGNQIDPLANATATLTTGSLIAAFVTAAASLLGAILGGLTGTRLHHNTDHAGHGSKISLQW